MATSTLPEPHNYMEVADEYVNVQFCTTPGSRTHGYMTVGDKATGDIFVWSGILRPRFKSQLLDKAKHWLLVKKSAAIERTSGTVRESAVSGLAGQTELLSRAEKLLQVRPGELSALLGSPYETGTYRKWKAGVNPIPQGALTTLWFALTHPDDARNHARQRPDMRELVERLLYRAG